MATSNVTQQNNQTPKTTLKSSSVSGLPHKPYILNCVKSTGTESDWSFGDAADGSLLDTNCEPKPKLDLRRPWWPVSDQGETGACVGYALADGVLRYMYEKHGLMTKKQKPSARFIWMANKETDNITRYPTTFLDRAGTSTKLALKVAKKYGCVEDRLLPMKSESGQLSSMNIPRFFTEAAKYRIRSYFNLRDEKYSYRIRDELIDKWKCWLNQHGPILVRLDVDTQFRFATPDEYILKHYKPDLSHIFGGHAICIVGYTKRNFIVRNSWGETWGKNGFALTSFEYAFQAFTEAYGAIL